MTDSIATTDKKETKLTFQEYQSFYSELTKKNEKLRKLHNKKFELSKNNIAHLKTLIDDTLRQYQVLSMNSNVVVNYVDNMQNTYSTIENFLTIDTYSKATEQLIVTYDILINVPNINKKQNYKIIITVISDLMTYEKDKKNIPIELLDIIDKFNIDIKIEYVDYTIAKSLLNVINDWVDDISEKDSKLLIILEKFKSLFSYSIKMLILIFTFLLIYHYVPVYIKTNTVDLQIFAKFSLIGLFILFISGKLASFLGTTTKIALTSLRNISSINITEEDKKVIRQFNKQIKFKIMYFIFTVSLTIFYGIISSIIATKMMQS